ncbi:MAG: TrkH family potassium uptake protein [Acetatifactor sp.]
MKKKYTALLTTRMIMLGFLIGIAAGTLLLCLPFSTRKGVDIDFIDALFVSVSSICVTGLSTINIGQTFSMFGQVVLLILIQIGGLGVVTFTTLILIATGKRLNLDDRILLQNAYNSESLTGLLKLTIRIVKITLLLEGIGAILYATVFLPQYHLKGIWYSIFHAVSAFCNAGIDLLGGNSFCMYRDNPMINMTTMALIVVSGLGFPVYWELARYFGCLRKRNRVHKLNLQAKIVLSATAFFILGGALVTMLFEWNNPDTLGTLPTSGKVMSSFFQSITLRTAGFATIDQSFFRESSCTLYLVLMLIGGSPVGTAGGIKTVTVVVLFASMIANIKGNKSVTLFRQKISDDYVRRCTAIATFSISVLFLLTTCLFFVQECDFLDAFYEMTSAIGTVGLSRGLTGQLTQAGKIILCIAMYLGRIGPITLAFAFHYKNNSEIDYAENKIIIG